ncbi:MAG: glycosyltransferase [Nitrososphaerota archaeon]|nr:glycosyltransferase [Nitrososphaerota archaeon]
MDRPFIFIAAPFEAGSGGMIRDQRVLPHLARLIIQHTGSKVFVEVPFSHIRFMMAGLAESIGVDGAEDEMLRKIEQSVAVLQTSGITLDVADWVAMVHRAAASLRRIRDSYSLRILDRKILSFGPFNIPLTEQYDRATSENSRLFRTYGGRPFLYSCHEDWTAIRLTQSLAKKFSSDCAVLLQNSPYGYGGIHSHKIFTDFSSLMVYDRTKNLYNNLIRERYLRVVLSVSPAPLTDASQFDQVVKRYKVPIRILNPAVSFDKKLMEHRYKVKTSDAVFFARLSPEKGIYDLLAIWKIVNTLSPRSNLRIYGSFHSDKHAKFFVQRLNSLRTDCLEMKGFVPNRRDLFREVSMARVLVYPSYSDAFPLVILESLALGLAVVAYDIPAITHAFAGLAPVFLARRGDIRGMAELVSKVIAMTDDEFTALHQNENVQSFLKTHASWEKVAESEFESLVPFIT